MYDVCVCVCVYLEENATKIHKINGVFIQTTND